MADRKLPSPNDRSPWPHVWAWLLVCTTFPLIWIGGFVTTTDAGMAFRDWLTSDGYFMPFYPWLSSAGDKFIEHGHRLLGMTAGILSIILVLVTWRTESRAWVRKFSLVLLAGVVLQGFIGGMRIVLDQRTLALVHGCTGPLYFGLTVAMVVFTSQWWRDASITQPTIKSQKAMRLAVLCTVLAYLQLVVGAVVRHSPHITSEVAASLFQAAVYFHLLLALMIVGHVLLIGLALLPLEHANLGKHWSTTIGRGTGNTWAGNLAREVRCSSMGRLATGRSVVCKQRGRPAAKRNHHQPRGRGVFDLGSLSGDCDSPGPVDRRLATKSPLPSPTSSLEAAL